MLLNDPSSDICELEKELEKDSDDRGPRELSDNVRCKGLRLEKAGEWAGIGLQRRHVFLLTGGEAGKAIKKLGIIYIS